jgi:hypothetical protein
VASVKIALVGALIGGICTGLALGSWFSWPGHKTGGAATIAENGSGGPDSLRQLLTLPTNRLATVDVGLMNLLCAEGLPQAGGISLQEAQRTLDDWAERVAAETKRNFHQFRANPAQFNNSEAYFRILVLVTVLQQDCGVHYDEARIEWPEYRDARGLFLEGLLGGERKGTCLSMPVLYVAVGRRLAYPLKLVTAKAHLFARWESGDGKERLNLEGTNHGLNCFADEYYQSWPLRMSQEEMEEGGYLKSLSPAEELAVFLSARGHCLEVNGRLAEAELAQAQAHVLAPQSPVYLAFLAGAVKKELPVWRQVQIDLGQVEVPSNKDR